MPDDAIFSESGDYRYRLDRDLALPMGEDRGRVLWVMFNPSVATATVDDATVKKVRGFSERHQHSAATIVNLFDLVTPDTREMLAHREPCSPANDDYIKQAARECDRRIVAWGSIGATLDVVRARIQHVWRILLGTPGPDGQPREVFCLGRTQDGQPKHPGRIGYDAELVTWSPPVDLPSHIARRRPA